MTPDRDDLRQAWRRHLPLALTPRRAVRLTRSLLAQGWRDRALHRPVWWVGAWLAMQPLAASTMHVVRTKARMTHRIWTGRSVAYRMEVCGQAAPLTDRAMIVENLGRPCEGSRRDA